MVLINGKSFHITPLECLNVIVVHMLFHAMFCVGIWDLIPSRKLVDGTWGDGDG